MKRWRSVAARATFHFVYFLVLTFAVLPALLSAVLGDGGWLAADRSWRSTLGLQLAAVLGHEMAHALLGHGRCLTAVGGPGADSPLRRARALFDQMGARRRVDECDTLIARASKLTS